MQLDLVIIGWVSLHNSVIQDSSGSNCFIRDWFHGQTLLVGDRCCVSVELAIMVESKSFLIKIASMERILRLVAHVGQANRLAPIDWVKLALVH